MKIVLCVLWWGISFTLSAQFKNTMLVKQEEGRYPPVEPSIVINKKDPKNIVAGIVLDRVVYTHDGGESWKETKLTSPYGVYGDPALVSDSKGNIYYFHLADPSGEGRKNEAWLDRLVCHQSKDGGETWNEGDFIGLNPPADQDKPWPAVNPRKGDLYVTWTQFDKYGSADTTCHSNILVSKSTKEGKKWSKPLRLNHLPGDCLDGDNTTEGAVPAVSYDGKLFVAWSNRGTIYLDRSYDGGEMWLNNDIAVTQQEGGWSMEIPGLGRCNGMPVLMIDNSPSKFYGSLYIVWADQRNGENDTDIYFVRSHNYGDNWSVPAKINQDGPGSHQFLPWMAVDESTGYIYIVYYDRRNHDDLNTDVYLAYSTDGGSNFSEVKISESPFVPSEEKFFGDYTNISAHKGTIAAVWTRMDEGKTSVWTAVFKHDDLVKK
ncbi:MAG: sialidase family protein [Cyclobacteriaceae bacterium]